MTARDKMVHRKSFHPVYFCRFQGLLPASSWRFFQYVGIARSPHVDPFVAWRGFFTVMSGLKRWRVWGGGGKVFEYFPLSIVWGKNREPTTVDRHDISIAFARSGQSRKARSPISGEFLFGPVCPSCQAQTDWKKDDSTVSLLRAWGQSIVHLGCENWEKSAYTRSHVKCDIAIESLFADNCANNSPLQTVWFPAICDKLYCLKSMIYSYYVVICSRPYYVL